MENEMTMAELLEGYEKSFKVPRKRSIMSGEVVQVTDTEVVVNLGYKADGIIPKYEISNDSNYDIKNNINEGDVLDVYVVDLDDGEGNVLLSLKRVSMLKDWDVLQDLYAEEKTITVKTTRVVKGGIIAFFNDIRGFIPASQLLPRYVEDLNKFVGKDLEVKILEVNKRKRRLVFSHKAIVKVALNKEKVKLWDSIEVGQVVDGVVRKILNFGAFIDVGGVDGLVHISEISWGKLQNPKKLLAVGSTIKVKVLSFNKEEEKISLSIKQTQPNPWEIFEEKYTIGEVYEGEVVNLTEFGAFVKLEDGLEGLVHISEISSERIEKPSDELHIGQKINVKIIDSDLENQKIKLSLKELE
ncbi:30S ribosomal protein S1 [Clostridiaceae bacterium HSG29]|nr:30S ribosomal protein S1 [Clostridiaceae bacterium HSG29]